jgi:hypothetical protein
LFHMHHNYMLNTVNEKKNSSIIFSVFLNLRLQTCGSVIGKELSL